ncbi:hypothetical protein BC833DRAFT_651233 [Globomyces pollinis-pini]|nr:hypothetical protein BC833DRAFT_651233 [Globomyces pollinis-pini]
MQSSVENTLESSDSLPPTQMESLPMDILHRIADLSYPEDVTQFSMAAKFFLPLRIKLFSKRKSLRIRDGTDLDELSNFLRDNIQSVEVSKKNFNLNSLKLFKNIQRLFLKFK